jgi:hypothetical protein
VTDGEPRWVEREPEGESLREAGVAPQTADQDRLLADRVARAGPVGLRPDDHVGGLRQTLERALGRERALRLE